MPEAMPKANGRRSRVRSAIEHVFARQKDKMKLLIRTISISKAKLKIGMANIPDNPHQYIFHQGNRAVA